MNKHKREHDFDEDEALSARTRTVLQTLVRCLHSIHDKKLYRWAPIVPDSSAATTTVAVAAASSVVVRIAARSTRTRTQRKRQQRRRRKTRWIQTRRAWPKRRRRAMMRTREARPQRQRAPLACCVFAYIKQTMTDMNSQENIFTKKGTTKIGSDDTDKFGEIFSIAFRSKNQPTWAT